MENNKNWLALAVVLIVAVVVVYFISGGDQNKDDESEDQIQAEYNVPEEQRISFVSGTITKLDGQRFFFDSGDGKEMIAVVSENTKLVKQVDQGDGVLAPAEAALSDFGPGSIIIVQPAPLAEETEYTPEKIQKIN
ncbi:MAG: hypothetical protein Q8P83_00095 [bacterium]|nr:hypothetical protein [bacterium]